MMLVLLGPVSSASPNGQGPLFSWFSILAGGYVAVSVWHHYLKRRHDAQIPVLNLVGISVVCLILIAVGIKGLLR